MNTNRILVTGTSGFIGRPLVAALLDAGYAVRVQDHLWIGGGVQSFALCFRGARVSVNHHACRRPE
jgi:dTDP-D-glucose 4,6-dehydratase